MTIGAPELATKEYWDKRYETDDKDGYDWFKKYSEISSFLHAHITSPSSAILVLGCGTSTLSEELYRMGWKHVTSIDFSEVAIDVLRTQNVERTEMVFSVMDIRKLEFSDASFDFVIDKGTMDAMLCYKGSPWDPPPDVVRNCEMEVSEAARVLKSGGKFLMLSFRPSHFLRPRVQTNAWKDDPSIEQFGDFYSTVVAEKR